MGRNTFFTFMFIFAFYSCKEHKTIIGIDRNPEQIVADHSIIEDFAKIPPYYIEEVKKMMVFFPGESHSFAYREGMKLLSELNSTYASNISTAEVETYKHLRINEDMEVGEAEWFTWYAYPLTSRPPESNTIKNLIAEYHDQGYPINVIGFAWCWDLFGEYSKLVFFRDLIKGVRKFSRDQEYGVYWYGTSNGGPDGTRVWGLDSADFKETGNRVSTDTYLQATEEYITFCRKNNYVTKVIFTTGPADGIIGEQGYQGYLKHQYIRNYVAADPTRILFDYNDILCYDDEGDVTTTTWRGKTYPVISPSNLGDGSIGHIGPKGAIRLAKAQWWMLARIAGWDGK